MAQSVRYQSYRLDKQGIVVRLPAPIRDLHFSDASRKNYVAQPFSRDGGSFPWE